MHVQKRMGTAKTVWGRRKEQYRGQKLADGRTIGGVGRLTDKLIDSLQNYYGDGIRKNRTVIPRYTLTWPCYFGVCHLEKDLHVDFMQ